MKTVAIVILNYLNYKDTIECVDSIKNDIYPNKKVIIVDNGSNNESLEELNKLYSSKEDIVVLPSNENTGFARGNNIGIKYAKEELKCDFVLMVNNDTVFEDPQLITELVKAYEPGIALIGPRIIAANGLDQNPVPIKINKEIIKTQKREYRKLLWSKKKLYIKLKKLIKGNNPKVEPIVNVSNKTTKALENICDSELVLHGACLMLTKDYFKYYPGLFPETFLYYEENILTLLTKKAGLKNKFISKVHIYHKEDQSSEMSFSNRDDVKIKYILEGISYAEHLVKLEHKEILRKYFNIK